MDPIRERIFMGAGDHSLAQMGHLHSQLERAFSTLSGIQQPPMATDSEEAFRQYEQEVEDGEIEIEMIAREIYIGLTGDAPPRELREAPPKPDPPSIVVTREDRMPEDFVLSPMAENEPKESRFSPLNLLMAALLIGQAVFFIYLFFLMGDGP